MKDNQRFVLSQLNTAVLFLVFNRLDTTMQVFEAIRLAKPPRLYIAADGPRESREGEAVKVQAVRDYVMNNIDWECEVKTLFRDKNLGCKYAVSSAITWFFENEEMGIILEDDCLPSQSFFWFCEELLERYKDDEDVGMISGNMLFNQLQIPDSYFYTYGNIWGWATWRKRWSLYDVDIKAWRQQNAKQNLMDFLKNSKVFKALSEKFDYSLYRMIDTWDYQWLFARLSNKLLTINPCKNLVSNIGFREDATHAKTKDKFHGIMKYELYFPLKHPPYKNLNHRYIELQYCPDNFIKKIVKNCTGSFQNLYRGLS